MHAAPRLFIGRSHLSRLIHRRGRVTGHIASASAHQRFCFVLFVPGRLERKDTPHHECRWAEFPFWHEKLQACRHETDPWKYCNRKLPQYLMAALKKGCRDGSRLRTTHHVHLPSLSPERERTNRTQRQPPRPPSATTLYAENLKEEALYLGSILCARLSDSAKDGNGRGLLSRALARGELDQFLVAFFSDPANLLFAREKVPFVGIRFDAFCEQETVQARVSSRPMYIVLWPRPEMEKKPTLRWNVHMCRSCSKVAVACLALFQPRLVLYCVIYCAISTAPKARSSTLGSLRCSLPRHTPSSLSAKQM